MAMRNKKDIKKSSYYVLFLGAQEARSDGIALEALTRLEARAALLEPFKVTLQITSKGLKIIQNVQDARSKAPRTVKHFLPADSVTEARTRGDAVVCILQLYNPVTRCPLHAHAYRCESESTARTLCSQLRLLGSLGPEEEETEIPRPTLDLGRDSVPKENGRSNPTITPETEEVAERLAQELRMRLREPLLLLPPRDYDEEPRRPPPQPVGPNAGMRRNQRGVVGSSAGSSGIGSDLAPSPERPHTSSEEDWGENTAYMLHDGFDVAMSPTRRTRSPSPNRDMPTSRNQHDRYSAGSVSPKDRFNNAKEKFLNMEREKQIEEIEGKRAQLRKNLNEVLARGPLSPTDVKGRGLRRMDDDFDDEIIPERRHDPYRQPMRNGSSEREYRENSRNREFIDRPKERSSSREYAREYKEPLDMRALRDVKPFVDDRNEFRNYRDHREYRDSVDSREQRHSKSNGGAREYREPRDFENYRDNRAPKEYREREIKESRDLHDYRDREFKEPHNYKDGRGYREERREVSRRDIREDSKERREYRESKNYSREPRKEYSKEYRDGSESREYREKDSRNPKYYREPEIREYRDARPEPKGYDEKRGSKEKTPHLEHRYREYKGDRQDKYFENRYSKHDNRSDDEGVESEKQFEEIKYVPHIEMPRKSEQRSLEREKNSIPRPVKDARVELLEERQRQIEGRKFEEAAKYERRNGDGKDWDILRRSYAEADRSRKDGRVRHSYAEPVRSSRVGMATVAPF